MKQTGGFTLLELMVVICILALLGATSTPAILSWMQGRKIGSASRDVLAAMQAARLRAVKERANAVVSFNLANDTFEAFVDDGTGGGTAANNLQDGSEVIFKSNELVAVDLTGANFGGNTFVVFTSRGFADSGTVTIQDGNGNQRQITVSSTGSSEIL